MRMSFISPGGDTGPGGLGSPSDPTLPRQPVTRPDGQTGTGLDLWRENPWYGGGIETDPVNPSPRATGSDEPTPSTLMDKNRKAVVQPFLLQLVYQDDGKVMFSYQWGINDMGVITGREGLGGVRPPKGDE